MPRTWPEQFHAYPAAQRWHAVDLPTGPECHRILSPIKIEDTNGNYITIAYSTASGADKQAISTITDTLGRILTFSYNSANELEGISVTPPGGTDKTVAYFNWGMTQLTYNFSAAITVADTEQSGSTISVLTSLVRIRTQLERALGPRTHLLTEVMAS